MKKSIRIENNWKWVSPHERQSKYGGCVDGPIEKRVPVYAVYPAGDKVFFVNNSDEVLKKVVSARYFAWPLEEDSARFVYENVKPGESVLIDVFDEYYDMDANIEQLIYVESEKSVLRFTTRTYGCITPERILLWDNGESDKKVSAMVVSD